MTSVPAALSVPLAVTRATLRGVVGRVGVPTPLIQSSARFSAVFERLSAMGLAPLQVMVRIPALRTMSSLLGGSMLIHTR